MITENAEASHSVDGKAIRCLEVWGGTEAVRTAITVPGIDAWVFSEPYGGEKKGGDIHYVSSCFTGRVARFAVADVSGHGSAASQMAEKLRALMRKHINYLDQTGLAKVLNAEFSRMSEQGRFATAVLCSYFAPTDHLIACNAGHPRPLWYRSEQGRWCWLGQEGTRLAEAPNNLPLGIIEPTRYEQFCVRLAPGDLVLIYTDSLIEANAPGKGPMLGSEGLLDLVQKEVGVHCSVDLVGRTVLEAVAAYRGGEAADDDQTLLVLHHNASEVPRQPVRETIRAIGSLLGLAGD